MKPARSRSTALVRFLGAVLLLASLAAPAAAQDPLGRPAPADTIRLDTIFEDMQAGFEALLPAMERLVRTLRQAYPELQAAAGAGDAGADAAALARSAARFTRAYFDALLDEGFTREEALRIVSGGAGRP